MPGNTLASPVRATTRTGYMMTSPKFSTWRPNQGTRIRVAFQLFASSRNDLFPQNLRSFAFEWWGSTWVWKKSQPMKFACSLEVKRLKTGVFQLKDLPDKAHNIWRQKGVFHFFDLWKIFFWNLHKICLLIVVLLSHSAVCLNKNTDYGLLW